MLIQTFVFVMSSVNSHSHIRFMLKSLINDIHKYNYTAHTILTATFHLGLD